MEGRVGKTNGGNNYRERLLAVTFLVEKDVIKSINKIDARRSSKGPCASRLAGRSSEKTVVEKRASNTLTLSRTAGNDVFVLPAKLTPTWTAHSVVELKEGL